MGVVLELVGREADATMCFERAVAIRPEVQQFHLNLAANLLLRGDFRRGWDEMEWRRMDPRSTSGRMFTQMAWNGAPLNGQTILIHGENPTGHTIQFLRYVKMVADRGGRVLLECQAELAPLARQMDGVAEVMVQGEAFPHFDLHCPIVSLARVFGTALQNVPGNVPYLKPAAEKSVEWAKKLPENKAGLRVGLAWADTAKSAGSRDRGCALEKLIPLSSVPGIQIFNLQKLETPLPAELKLVDFGSELKDLHDTAGLIEQMDVVVGTETAAIHLAAAMGKKTFVLLPSTPDWRWMVGREDSVWYPTVKLFRQSSGKSWSDVVDGILAALTQA